jgi:hypothetical protein
VISGGQIKFSHFNVKIHQRIDDTSIASLHELGKVDDVNADEGHGQVVEPGIPEEPFSAFLFC